jgi:hypothetical protein
VKDSAPPFQPILIAAGLFLLALLIRLPYLGAFMTIDEVKWMEGAGQFAAGLAHGDFFATYWHFFPGITTTWGEAIILWLQYLIGNAPDFTAFVAAHMQNLAGIVGAMRLSQVVLTSLCVAGIYGLARPLLGHRAALLGAALLAVDPFFVAHSRIVNGDALSAALMLMAILAFARLWQIRQRRWVGLAGMLAGLAILTKLPAPIILPFMAVPALPGYLADKNRRFWPGALVGVGLAAGLTFVALFPAMWVNPVETLRLIYVEAFDIGGLGEGHDTFFLGQISNDPGWLFYPYAIAFRLTPIVMAGLLVGLVWLWKQPRRLAEIVPRLVITLLIYVIFVYLFANISPKKLDRYIMAVIPALLLIAGVGWGWLIDAVAQRLPAKNRIAAMGAPSALAVMLVIVQAYFTIANYPYVLTYFNPFLGGFARAAQQTPVGWGEGMEQAAAWLNARPNAAGLRVSSWYGDMMDAYLRPQSSSFSSNGKGQLQADYVVFYINQVQRQKPNPATVAYFMKEKPAFQVDYQGTPYVWVFVAPAMESAPGSPKIEGRARWLGYKWQPPAPQRGGDTAGLTLFMNTLGDLPPNETFAVALAAADGALWGRWQSTGGAAWQPHAIVEWSGRLTLPPDVPPGEYQLIVRLLDTNLAAEVTRFVPDDPIRVILK